MTPEAHKELVRQFISRVAGLTYEIQDVQQMFYALAGPTFGCYDRYTMVNDALELLRRDAKVAWDRAQRVSDDLEKSLERDDK